MYVMGIQYKSAQYYHGSLHIFHTLLWLKKCHTHNPDVLVLHTLSTLNFMHLQLELQFSIGYTENNLIHIETLNGKGEDLYIII